MKDWENMGLGMHCINKVGEEDNELTESIEAINKKTQEENKRLLEELKANEQPLWKDIIEHLSISRTFHIFALIWLLGIILKIGGVISFSWFSVLFVPAVIYIVVEFILIVGAIIIFYVILKLLGASK